MSEESSEYSFASEDENDEEPPMLVNVDSLEEVAPPRLVPAEDSAEITTDLPPCPVTILSGFLGSGKTTLVQYILQSPDHGKRIAVIENEFGGGNAGLSVESMIARDGANQDSLSELIELPNGCVCCTVKDSLVTTLENLLEKRHDLDYILIEASGMANPGPIASLFWLDDALESRLRLDGVVTIVDAYHIGKMLQETHEASQQIAYADRILLNKTDLVTKEQLNETELVIRSINPTAPIQTTRYSKVPDLDWILDANCFDADKAKEIDTALDQVQLETKGHPSFPCSDSSCVQCTEGLVMCTEIHLTHAHTSEVGTIALVQAGSVDLRLINTWMASLLWPNQDEQDRVLRARLEQDDSIEHQPSGKKEGQNATQIFRIKGILSVQRGKSDIEKEEKEFLNTEGIDVRRYIVQAVHDLWEIHPASSDLRWDRLLDGETDLPSRTCKLIVIGRFLQENELKSGFASCFRA